ncbi:PEGA domain-containing protein [Polyangium sp. 6x1]|uniref:PEGA domain-containing protein n=1 Tax=Polyangium sp. 6x1 TaxID=3042689 RepID=UPI0024821E58|nr:PEGA domain-containing protein [Polyangium sp. 6x1]MDI1447057.1 PEGA domain-containing protein [Polyangium sp. 6x1]
MKRSAALPSPICKALAVALASTFVTTALAQNAPGGQTNPKPQPSWLKKGGPLPPPPPPPPPPPDPAAEAEAKAKADARKHFEQGLALFDAGSMEAALPEFLTSLSIYPTRAAKKNAALCLRRLNRFDEAFDMNEELLAFPGVTEEEKQLATHEIAELRPLVGDLVVEGVPDGATISIDGKPRGTTPLKGPIHVPVGERTVRIFKAGFETLEARLQVVGGKTAKLPAVLSRLELAGWLQVDEASGYSMDVLLDGAAVGKTPWRGLVASGDHLVSLRGDKRLGTQPARIEVRPSLITPILLIAEELPSVLRVETKTKDADISVDGVRVGRGAWEGPVRAGAHRIEVTANGFVREERRVDLESGKREAVAVALEPVPPPLGFWADKRFFGELGATFAIAPTFGGSLDGTCTGPCAASLGLGGGGALRFGLEIQRKWLIGVELGGLFARRTFTDRPDADVHVFGNIAANKGLTDDVLSLQGAHVGASVARTVGERFPITFRLGAGGFFGSAQDDRSGDYKTTARDVPDPTSTTGIRRKDSVPYTVDRVTETQAMLGAYVAPEIRAGMRISDKLDVAVSVSALVLFVPEPPSWVPEQGYVQASTDGQGKYDSDTLTGAVIFTVSPGLVATYRF